jgi:hypothetical protein
VVVRSVELVLEVGVLVLVPVILVARVVLMMGTVEIVVEDVLLTNPFCIVLDVLARNLP